MSNEQLLAARKSSLEEIISKAKDDNTIFNEYVAKKDLAVKIFKELNRRYNKNEKGFYLQDGSKDIGILSRCHCLQTLMSLAQDFGLDFKVDNYFAGQKGTIREIMDDVIEKIIESVCRDNNGKTSFVFDASPYDTEHFNEEYSNVDTITWVVTTFLLVLKYHANNEVHEVCKWEPVLIDVIKAGMDYLDKAFIQDESYTDGLNTGWNFTKDCVEPSLYFTFTVCECYLDVFSSFKSFLEYLHMVRNEKEYGVPVDPAAKLEFEQKALEYEENRNREVGERQAKYDEYNEMARIYRLINDIDDFQPLRIDETTRYGRLEKHCKDVAKKVWEHVHKNLADSFFYNNLTDTLSEKELRAATTSDALFNSVYIVNIMVGAGLDEILDLEKEKAIRQNNLPLARKKEQEYNNLLESCLLAVQKAFRTYESLRNDGKEYIVDQFLDGFNEKFDGHPVAINELRKLRMRCFSLLPLLIHTNNVVSEYLVRYPQYNMRKYLEYILDNRLTAKDGAPNWIWEADGYFSGSNYYYVLALNEFYLYYESFEHKYIEIGEKNAQREAEIRAKHMEELQSAGGALYKKDEDLQKKDKKIAAQQKEIEALRAVTHPVEDAVRQVATEEIEQQLAAMMAQVFTNASKALVENFVDDTRDTDGTYGGLAAAMQDMLVTTMLSTFIKADATNSIANAKAYADLRQKVERDMKQISKRYVANVKTMENNESALHLLLKPKN